MMKTNIKIPANSMKTRVLSMFMAFLIFVLTFQQAFVGWDIGLRVRAEAGDGNIRATSTNKTSSMKNDIQTRANAAAGGTSPYTYSGEYTDKNKITLFDYVSDYELIGTYNNCSQKEEGYVDAYKAFNGAISGNVVSPVTDNITIVIQNCYTAGNAARLNMWDDSGHGTGYPGVVLEDCGNGEFKYTFSTTTSTNNGVGFMPIYFQFTRVKTSGGYEEKVRYKCTDLQVGKVYYFNNNDRETDSQKPVIKDGETYYIRYFDGGVCHDNIYNSDSCSYTNPLYFGCFWRSNTATAGNDVSDNNKWNAGYDSSNKASYNNFFWQANMGLKTILGTNSDESENHFNQRGSASTQGLICSVLEGGARGNIKDTNGTTELPYFDKNSSLVSSGLMKYYDHDGTKGDIVFPFYEVTTTTGTSYTVKDQSNPSNTTTYSNLQIKNGNNLTGGSLESGEKARFYQFNSKDANLKFVIEGDDPSKNSGYFQESNNDIYRDNDVGTNRKNVGFFPFNSSDTANKGSTNTHNLGFGTKFEMDFQLEDDGCVSAVTVDQNGNVNDANSGTRIHSVFEFEGDDDLWVFIDGQLVLDMGGAHYKSHGIIDFASRTVTVDKAITLGADDGTSKDNLAATVRTPLDTGADCTRKSFTLSSSNSYDSNNKYTKRNHTMTIFYMERGMLDSNLLIRFNYAPTPNLSRMKIAEATRFDDVNPGLLSYTQKAAEDDIFQYTVKNNGTNSQDVKDNTAVYPKGVSSVRTNEGDSTITTQLQQGSNTAGSNSVNFEPHDTGSITNNDWASGGEQPVHDTSYLWVDKFAAQPKLTGKTNSNGQLYLMYGTDIAVYDSDDDTESSAEFEKQFSKDSIMRVIQGEKVYSPTRTANMPYNLFGGANNEVFQPSINNSRSVADYYTTTYKLVDRNFTEIPLTNYGLERNHAYYGTFTFSNAATTDQYQAVMLTEYFINTVKTGTLTIENEIVNGTENEEFTYTITLNNVFGTGENVSDFSTVKSDKLLYSTNFTYPTVSAGNSGLINSGGTFTLKNHQKLVIQGVPYGTTYKVIQTSKEGVTTTVTGQTKNESGTTSTENITISMKSNSQTEDSGSGTQLTAKKDHIVHFLNERSMSITAEKTDGNTTGLSGAELELYYRETTTPPTYSFNEPKVVPMKKIQNKIPSGNGITLPDPEIISETIEIKKTTIEYGSDTPPTASDSDWILPRNDSDYIYFRDYNDANGGFLGDKDKTSFGSSGKVAWRETKFEDPSTNNGVHGQNEEIGFKDEGEGKYPWVAAQFTKNNGQDFVEYAVWERFVDTYNGIQTVVWKIQPPDGYDEVRFCLYYGDKCVRTTKRFKFKLGKIYHKTNWGSSYSSDNGGSYWDVPVTVETANSGYWAPVNASVNDKRMSGSTMAQARKYEPTEQKIIFHCNSQEVWHNIHIEFFEDEEGNFPVNGQPFPGYMMEPYAYAGSDYRLSDGYLTYELTIPKTANYFRINNGIDKSTTPGKFDAEDQSRYAYRTNIQAISKTGGKNYDNYYVLATNGRKECLSNGNPIEVPLIKSVNAITNLSGENTNVSYTDKDVDSDYDYIYFEKPSGWKDHVYAYFYGGGNLRADNWQRACYSAWPGVAAAGTEYTDNGTEYYSSTYNYPIADDGNASTLEEYNGTILAENKLSPESTFKNSNGKTVYKFRIPKGDRKNYSKVIFNDGLSSQGGKYETGVIDYEAGYLYRSDGSCQKHYDNNPTVTYTARTGNDDYIYVKIDSITANTWDDPHITFYDNYGRQVLQGGHGYVMDYAGTQHDYTEDKDYQYYRIPIPADSTGATKFKINNGMSRTNETTNFYDILKKGTHEDTVTSTDYTEGKLVYKLSGNALTRTEPTFKETETNDPPITISNEQDSGVDYDYTRGDKLKILDDAPWITVTNAGDGIGTVKVKFYNSSGTVIGTKGIYTMIQSKADANSKRWYSIEIPDGAAKFTLTYPNGTTAPYDIYEYSPNSDGKDANNTTIDGNWTADGMYYRTKSDKTLELISSTVQATGNTVEANDETYSKRGDNLYLVTSDTFSDIKVVFYGADGTAFQTDANAITAKYIADDGSDHWYKVSIPKNAVSFKVIANNGAVTLQQADIYELKTKIARYKENYTLGDMQYRITNSNGSAPTLLYPVFTQDDEYTIDVGGNTISSNIAIPQVDESAVSGYSEVGVTPVDNPAISEPDGVVLYNTNPTVANVNPGYNQTNTSSNVEKKWNEGTVVTDTNIYFDNKMGWSTVKIYFYGSGSNNNTGWNTLSMTPPGSGESYYKFDTSSLGSNTYTKVIFSNGSTDNNVQTVSADYTGPGKKYVPLLGNLNNNECLFLYNPTGNNSVNTNNQDIYAYFDGNYTSGQKTGNDWSDSGKGGTQGSRAWYKSNIGTSHTKAKFKINNGGWTNEVTFKGNGIGEVYELGGTSSNPSVSFKGYLGDDYQVYAGNSTQGIPLDIGSHSMGSNNQTTYKATYQIEDRYGYVNSINSTYGDTADDKNNYIYINTSNVTTSGFAPYVRFYTNTAGNEGEICGVNTEDSTDTINIKADQVATSLYRVRLPKNAKSFKIFNGKGSTSGSSAIPLEENVTVNTSTGQIATAGVGTVSITGFRHAGTTFNLNSSGGVGSKALREGYTVGKDEAMADPLNPKTDADFVYFTDTGSFANDGKVYAYYYGDVDGAYTSWPGVKAMTPNDGVADTTYTDNNDKKVYAFRIPKGSEGKYSKVVFTNGKTDSNIKITQAQDLTGGANYVLNTTASGQNGAFAVSGKVYPAAATNGYQKSSMPTVDYSTSEGKTIYIINNGTPDSVTGSGSSVTVSRTPLDDMHIVFYDASNNAINHTDGYKPDKVVDEQYEGTDVYKITVPDNAEYFRITNGTGKGSSGGRERHSEIKKLTDKGLYRFIEPSEVTAANKDASSGDNYVQETTFNSTLSANTYLLGLANQIQESDEELPETNTTDIYLATIVTGTDGKQDYIKWLKPDPETGSGVDTAYLQAAVAYQAAVADDPGTPEDETAAAVEAVNQIYDGSNDYTKCKVVKVVKSGEYYWKESKAPTGYQIDESLKAATGDTTIIGDKPIKGKLKLVKELADGMPSSLDSQNFVYTVTLTAPTVPVAKKFVNDGGTIKIQNADVTGTATALGITLESGSYKTDPSLVDATHIKFEVEVSKSAYIVVKDIPYDVGYSVSEAMPDRTWKRVSPSGTEPITGKITANDTYTATFTNAKTEEPTDEVILTKTAKEKVGTTDIGDTLAGAKFKLVDVNETDSTKVIKFKLTQVDPDTTDTDTRKTNIYTVDNSGSYNVTYSWLETGEDGRLHIKGLSPGDYYLEEQTAPNGYSNLDSNRLDNSGNAQPKRVYFSAGDNTKLKNITCSDEMAPAYIKLFEHINEWRPSEWGNPTFIFKIKQTGYYAWSEPAEPEEGEEPTVPVWQLTTTNSGKEILVALTVNDDGTLNTNVLTGSVTGKTFTGWKVESTDENIAVDENTTVKEYQGMFDIDSQGRIRVEPGSYEITRMPISRYEFVTSAATEPYDNGSTAGDQTENLDSNSKPLEKVTISPLEAGKTVDVHYYDEVGYYDKFSQVDTNVNQFYQLNSTTKANKTIKGIRILDYHQVGKIGDDADTVDVTDDSVEPPVTTQTMTVPVANLKIYKIMSDGSEVEMTDSEKAALTGTNFIVSYTYDLESGDKESFGHATSPATNDFSYDNTDEDSNDLGKNPSIVVHNSQKYENGVYTLKAKYKTDANTEFTTTFDLVFLRSST